MRFPYTIDINTKIAYEPSQVTLDLLGEVNRTIFSEKLDFVHDEHPTLVTLCIEAIAKNFQIRPLLDQLPGADKDNLLEILSLDLPLELTVPLINDKIYWKRRFSAKFGLYRKRKMTGWTWKCVYLESELEKLLEEAQPEHKDEENLNEFLQLCYPYVRRLIISQLQAWRPPLHWDIDEIPEKYPIDHISFQSILPKLINLQEFDLIYGVSKLGIDRFDPRMFSVSIEDCRKLARSVIPLENLTILKLHKSKIGGLHTQALAQELANNKSIIELDLSHCEIDDHGASCLAKLMLLHPKLEVVNLTGNQIRTKGAEAIGFALLEPSCCPLIRLNLRMNPLGHDGTMGILRALVRLGDKPREVILSGCLFEDETAVRVAQMLKINTSLEYFDVSNNWFGKEAADYLVESLTLNPRIKWLDLRDTDVPLKHLSLIKRILQRNIAGETEIAESIEEEIIEDVVSETEEVQEEQENEEEN